VTDEPIEQEETKPEPEQQQDAHERPEEAEVDVQALIAERDEYLDHLKRVAAEFENYRKRAARDQENLAARAAERLVRELLPVLDGLERAIEAAEEHEEAKLEEGVRLVHRQFAEALRKEGLQEVPTEGDFDPHVHEALMARPDEGREAGAIVDVVQKGYRIGEKVIRPARVIVAE
jgi:molecular chaperone GrpE